MTGVVPAVPFRMLHSRFVPALLCVALVHAALIAVFVATTHTPASRRVEVATIAAQLLPMQPDTAHAAAPSMSAAEQPQAHPERPSTAEPNAHANKQPPPRKSRPHPPATALPSPATAPEIAPAAAIPTDRPPQPAPNVRSNSVSVAAQPAAAAAPASSAAPPTAPNTMTLAAPKHVEHADCRIVRPAYPELSKRRGETGTASVRFIIGTSGTVENVTLAKSSGFARLDDAAIEALRQSTCRPYVENGSAIRVSVVQAFKFGLDDD